MEGVLLMTEEQRVALARAQMAVQKQVVEDAVRWPPYNSAHEAYGVLAEEFREFEAEVFLNQSKRDATRMRAELVQIAAVATRAIAELDDPAWVLR
jgi:hypothetical protein